VTWTLPFRPSQVVLAPVPLVGTMRRAEVEFAAALLVRACQVLGDRWQPLSWQQVAKVLRADRTSVAKWLANPFFRPDVHDLVARGYAAGNPTAEVWLTAAGLEALERWVRPPWTDDDLLPLPEGESLGVSHAG
jgi:hypothetical protein